MPWSGTSVATKQAACPWPSTAATDTRGSETPGGWPPARRQRYCSAGPYRGQRVTLRARIVPAPMLPAVPAPRPPANRSPDLRRQAGHPRCCSRAARVHVARPAHAPCAAVPCPAACGTQVSRGRWRDDIDCAGAVPRWGTTTLPSGSSSPVSSKAITPLHSSDHPCSG